MRGTRRLRIFGVVAFVAAVISVAPVAALAQGGGGGTPTPSPPPLLGQNVDGKYANHLIDPTLAQSDLTLHAQGPWVAPIASIGGPRPPHPLGPGGPVSQLSYLPYLNQPCALDYNAGIDVTPVVNNTRREQWLTPDAWIADKYDATAQIQGWLAYDPKAPKLFIEGHPDGYYITSANPVEASIVAEHQTVEYAAQLEGASDVTVPYKLTGTWKPIASPQGAICEITDWNFAGKDQMSFRVCKDLQPLPCWDPIVNVTPALTNPPCASAACVPAVQTELPAPQLLAQAKQTWQDGGAVISAAGSPDLMWEAVGLPANMKLSGPPVDTPDQYLGKCVPVGNVRLTAACFQVHLRMGGATWKLSNDETGAIQDICTATISCDYKFDRVGHYHMRAVEDVGVEYRYVMYTSSSTWIYQDWTPYPGLANFQLCARPATVNPPDCAPGQPIVVGQFEAIPAVPAPTPSPSPSPY